MKTKVNRERTQELIRHGLKGDWSEWGKPADRRPHEDADCDIVYVLYGTNNVTITANVNTYRDKVRFRVRVKDEILADYDGTEPLATAVNQWKYAQSGHIMTMCDNTGMTIHQAQVYAGRQRGICNADLAWLLGVSTSSTHKAYRLALKRVDK